MRRIANWLELMETLRISMVTTLVVLDGLALFLLVPFLASILDHAFGIPELVGGSLNLAGIAPLTAGVVLMLHSYWALSAAGRGIWPPTDLVMTGAYSRVRHPIYLGYSLILFGLSMLLRSTSLLWVSVVFTTAIFAFLVPYEERQLKGRFGNLWEFYRGAVPSFLPWPGRRAPSLRIELVDETSARETSE